MHLYIQEVSACGHMGMWTFAFVCVSGEIICHFIDWASAGSCIPGAK